jgi:ADP-ribose pyrophosphatase YjhB (NUDIX family)
MNNFKTKKALDKIINSKKCIEEILAKNPDKIYLYAKKIENLNNNFKLKIDSKNCIVVLNEKTLKSMNLIIKSYNLEEIIAPTVSQIRDGSIEGILFSAGVIAKNNNNDCLMLERDSGAPTEPNCWQFPAGRCEDINSINTAKSEIQEEISVINPENNSLISVSEQVADNHKDYTKVDIYIDEKLSSENRSFAVFDKEFNTLEQFYFSKINKTNYLLKDNEFDRKVSYISLEMLKNNEIRMVELLNKEKKLFLNCFKKETIKKRNKL